MSLIASYIDNRVKNTMSLTPEFIYRQCKLLEQETNDPTDDASAFHNSIVCSQHESTSRHIRQAILQLPPAATNQLKHALTQYVDLIEKHRLAAVLRLEETVEIEQRRSRRRLSVDLHNVNDAEDIESIEEKQEDNENLSQLRKRLLDGRSKSSNAVTDDLTYDEKLHEEEKRQEDIMENMLTYVQGIKEGAMEFQHRLNQDQDVLTAAQKGLEVTSEKLAKTTFNLSKTIESMGWRELLKYAAFCLFSFIFALLLIGVLPRL